MHIKYKIIHLEHEKTRKYEKVLQNIKLAIKAHSFEALNQFLNLHLHKSVGGEVPLHIIVLNHYDKSENL